ncbi:MAG: hypothetical protein ACOYJ2_00455 [Rickettsiales bacterium]
MSQPFQSVLVGISTALPASSYAQEQLQRAANAGFKWPKAEMVVGKIEEELREVREAEAEGNKEHLAEEIGDLLHAIHTLIVFHKVDAQEVLYIAQALPTQNTMPTLEDRLSQLRPWLTANTSSKMNRLTNFPSSMVRSSIGLLLKEVHAFAEQHGIDPEAALESTNAKFAYRFTRMEERLSTEGSTIADTIASKGLKHLVVNYWNTEKAGTER